MNAASAPDCLYYGGFDAHASWGPRSPVELVRVLKLQSLFYRGLFVSDSDLNNGPLFAQTSVDVTSRDVLKEALGTGVLRRLPRLRNGGPASQQEVFEVFRQRCPDRAQAVKAVNPDWPRQADEWTIPFESRQIPAAWEEQSLASVFHQRLGVALGLWEPLLRGPAKTLVLDLLSHLRISGSQGLLAGQIEREFLPGWRQCRWKEEIWNRILRCYCANTCSIFGGQVILMDPQPGSIEAIPGGPELSNDAIELALDCVKRSVNGGFSEVEDHYDLVRITPSHPRPWTWALDLKKLWNLSLAEIVELRERACPTKFFHERFHVLAGTALSSTVPARLEEARDEFYQSLASAGLAMQAEATEKPETIEARRKSLDQLNRLGLSVVLEMSVSGLGMLVTVVELAGTSFGKKRYQSIKRRLTEKQRSLLDPTPDDPIRRPNFEILRRVRDIVV